LKEDFSNMTWDRIRGFPFESPKMESWRWEEKIRGSGILEFLKQAPHQCGEYGKGEK